MLFRLPVTSARAGAKNDGAAIRVAPQCTEQIGKSGGITTRRRIPITYMKVRDRRPEPNGRGHVVDNPLSIKRNVRILGIVGDSPGRSKVDDQWLPGHDCSKSWPRQARSNTMRFVWLVSIPMCGDLVIFGAWHFSQVVTEAAELNGWRVVGYVDPDPPEYVTTMRKIPEDMTVIVSVGENSLRARVFGKLMERRRKLTALVHPSAVVSRTASIGLGSYVGENAVVRSNAVIGMSVFVNAGAIVSHDCNVGDFVTLGPNAAAAGHVTVGAQTLIGVGSSIRPWVRIGSRCEIGAGAAAVSDVPDDMAAIGVPARAVPKSTKAGRQSDWSRNVVW